MWDIADVEKFPYRPSDPDMMAKLMRFVPVAAERETRTCRRRRVATRLPQEAGDETLVSPLGRSSSQIRDHDR